jgi:hypothetical protein
MPHDIIDNRETFLADAVRPLLTQSERAHFAVGFFFLSGFKAIAKELETVRELRLLVGNTSSRETLEQLAEAHQPPAAIQARQRDAEFLSPKQRAALVAAAARKIRQRLERLDPTNCTASSATNASKSAFTPAAASTPRPTSSTTPLAASSAASPSWAARTFPLPAFMTTPS